VRAEERLAVERGVMVSAVASMLTDLQRESLDDE
jgi:hypothetical protein